jgi:transcriptional regulator with GAF, ATPase, and Fis domain
LINTDFFDIVYRLSTKSITPAEFDNPNKYLKWYFETLMPLFTAQEKLLFTNVQFFDFSVSDNNNFKNGRLNKFPTVYWNTDFESFVIMQSEILTFLLAVIINQQISAGGATSSINAFQDKVIVESITKDKNNFGETLLHFNDQKKIISFNLPDLYDPDVSKIYMDMLRNKLKKTYVKNDSPFHISTDEILTSIIDEIFSLGKFQQFIPILTQFLQSQRVAEISEQCYVELSKLNRRFGFSHNEVALKNFITTALLHSWIKNCKYNYMFTSIHYDTRRNPVSYAILLVVTNEKISDEKLNLFHTALNIAFSALTEIQKWFIKKDTPKTESKTLLREKLTKRIADIKGHKSGLVYKSSVMQKIDFEITKIARSDENVLLLGETGTGKDLIASEIHKRGSRADKPFYTLPINNLSETLIESELFGYLKGSFTGASEDRNGRLESANEGIIYLPEISELPQKIQLKLLEFFQYKYIEKIGENEKKHEVNTRLIFATNANLNRLVEEGKLREDFYYRINVVNLQIPPLRERLDDVQVLAEHFVEVHSKRIKGERCKLDKSAIELLMQQEWKGNVRELEHLIISALVRTDDCTLNKNLFLDLFSKKEDSSFANKKLNGIENFRDSELEFKRNYFMRLIKQTNGKVAAAAKIAGISRQALYNICRELNIKI